MVWSEPDNGRFDPQQVARDLHEALRMAGERPPYVLVGHSLGGPYSMIFTSLYPADVAGLVFVDASHPDQLGRMHEAANAPDDDSAAALHLLNALSWAGVPRLLTLRSGGDATPPGMPKLVETISDAYIGTSFGAVVRESDGLKETFRTAGRFRDLGDRPLVVLTGDNLLSAKELAGMHMSSEQGRRWREEWRKLQNEEAAWSRHSRHELIASPHYVQFYRPDLVIAAIRSVVEDLRHSASQTTHPAASAPTAP
jgi:pimeloyl-ACP methyl ester carboxylesterase